MVRRLVLEDLRLVRMIHDLNADVDGDILAFTVSKIADSLEDYERNIWIYDGKSLRQVTRGNSDFSPRILGGKGLVFLSRRGLGRDKPGVEVWHLPFDGGEPMRIAYIGGGVNDLRIVNGVMYFMSNVGPIQEDVKFVEDWPLWFNGRGFVHTFRSHLFSLDLSGAIRQVTSGDFDVNAYDVEPGGKRVAIAVSTNRFKPYRNEVWVINLESGERYAVLSNYSVSAIKWSLDGKYLALVGNDLHRGFRSGRYFWSFLGSSVCFLHSFTCIPLLCLVSSFIAGALWVNPGNPAHACTALCQMFIAPTVSLSAKKPHLLQIASLCM